MDLMPFQPVILITSKSLYKVCPTSTRLQRTLCTSLRTAAHVGAFLKCPKVTPENSVLQSIILDSGLMQLSNSSSPFSPTIEILATCSPSTHSTNSQSRATYSERGFGCGDFELLGVDNRKAFQFWEGEGFGLELEFVPGWVFGLGVLDGCKDGAGGFWSSQPRILWFLFRYSSIGMVNYSFGLSDGFLTVLGSFSGGSSVSNSEIFFSRID